MARRKTPRKEEDDRVSRLFDNITAILEQAHELTVEGQSQLATAAVRRRLLRRLDARLERCRELMANIATLLAS